jgi:hypothetical protein
MTLGKERSHMHARMTSVWIALGFALGALNCGSGDPDRTLLERPSDELGLHVERQLEGDFAASFTTNELRIELASIRSAELAGDVTIDVGALAYEVHYDYAGREIVADGHGGAIDRTMQRALAEALAALGEHLGPSDSSLPFHEQMSLASLVLLEESAGMQLSRTSFPLEPLDPDATGAESLDKSLGNDGIGCIRRNTTYAVSFDFGSTQVLDLPVTSNSSECNGQCGPYCTRLTPWVMWTLDCLEHDTCCRATSDGSCFTPLGECGDEYVDAEADFLSGFDPFGKHCKG